MVSRATVQNSRTRWSGELTAIHDTNCLLAADHVPEFGCVFAEPMDLRLSPIQRRSLSFFIREYLRQPGATARYVEDGKQVNFADLVDVIEATR